MRVKIVITKICNSYWCGMFCQGLDQNTTYSWPHSCWSILWAIQLAYLEKWKNILVESDAKNCVDAILGISACSWNIYALCNDVKRLALDFSSCSFCWVKREANMVAHELAKSFIPNSFPTCYFFNNLSASVQEAWSRDLLCISVFVRI
jgi:hypothetical protein